MLPGFRCALLVACALLLPIGGADKVRGAIVALTHGTFERVELLSRAISSVNKAFNSRLQYPIVVFTGISHGERPDQLPKREWLDWLANQTTARLIFAEVNFTDYYYSAPHSADTPGSIEGYGRGYRDMCRFFGGMISEHPVMQQFDYYLRMDSDSEFKKNVRYDVMASMRHFGWRYGYTATECDWWKVTQGLYDVVDAHVRKVTGSQLELPPAFSTSTSCNRKNASEYYNNGMFYNNFEVVDLAWMRSPEYRAAFQAVDDSGGLYYFRWGDAPIRTLLVLALLPLDQIHHFRIGGYKHVLEVGDDYRDPLPARTVHPGYPESEDATIIAIAAETGSPLPPGMTVALEETPTPSPLPAPTPPSQGDEPSASPEVPAESALRGTALVTVPSEVHAAGKAKGAIVVLTHGSHERILLLDRAIQSLDESFNNRLRYPIVVFTGVSYGEPRDWLPKPEWLTWLANRTSSRIIFAEVNFSDYINAPHSAASPGHVENYGRGYRDMCRFFAGRIMDHPVMAEFDYYMRMDSDSEFKKPIRFDIMGSMKHFGWRYGFTATECDWWKVTQGLYNAVDAHVRKVTGSQLVLPTEFSSSTRCHRNESSDHYNNFMVYNNFEVMDMTWMRSPEYRAAFQAVDDAGGIYNFRWGDAPIRTLLVLALLPLDQIHHFRVVGYKHVLEVGDDYRDPLPTRGVHPGYPELTDDAIIAVAKMSGTPLPPGLSFGADAEAPTINEVPAESPDAQEAEALAAPAPEEAPAPDSQAAEASAQDAEDPAPDAEAVKAPAPDAPAPAVTPFVQAAAVPEVTAAAPTPSSKTKTIVDPLSTTPLLSLPWPRRPLVPSLRSPRQQPSVPPAPAVRSFAAMVPPSPLPRARSPGQASELQGLYSRGAHATTLHQGAAATQLPLNSAPPARDQTASPPWQGLGRDTLVLFAALALFFVWVVLRRGRGHCCGCGSPTAGKPRPGVKLRV